MSKQLIFDKGGHIEANGSTTESKNNEVLTSPSHPAGATRAYFTVLGCFLIQFSTVASLNSFGAFEDFYASQFLPSSSASRISWIIGLEILLELGLGAVGGKLSDLGYTRALFATGSSIYIVSFFLLSLAQKDHYYQVILAQAVGMGIGVGLCYAPALVAAARHFPSKQAIAMGAVVSSGSFGGGIFSIMLNELIPKIGFPSAVRSTAYLALGLLILGNILVTVPPRQPAPKTVVGKTNMLYVPYLLTLISGCVGQMGGLFPLFYIQLFADSHHMAKGFIFYAITAMTFSTAIGRIIPSYFADRYGAVGTYIICGFLTGSSFVMFGAKSPAGFVVFCILYGFFYGSTTSLFIPVITTLMPSEADKGKLVGVAIAPVAISSLVGSPLGGKIIGKDYDWWKGIVWTGALLGSALMIQIIARQIHRNNTRTVV